jgi:hypothetical protein
MELEYWGIRRRDPRRDGIEYVEEKQTENQMNLVTTEKINPVFDDQKRSDSKDRPI